MEKEATRHCAYDVLNRIPKQGSISEYPHRRFQGNKAVLSTNEKDFECFMQQHPWCLLQNLCNSSNCLAVCNETYIVLL
jgi:hypothetical protein